MTGKREELAGNIGVFEAEDIRLFSAKGEKIHGAIPHNAFIHNGIPLIEVFVWMDLDARLLHQRNCFVHMMLI